MKKIKQAVISLLYKWVPDRSVHEEASLPTSRSGHAQDIQGTLILRYQ